MDTSKIDDRHGGPYDRGAADSYYGRPFAPHYFEGSTGKSLAVYPAEGSQGWIEYSIGYKENSEAGNFKDWG